MVAKLHIPPEDLFDQLRQDLAAEGSAIAKLRLTPSPKQKLNRYLEYVKKFDAKWLARLAPPRESIAQPAARDAIGGTMAVILRAVTHTESLSEVVVPSDVSLVGITPDGKMAPPEYPDVPVEPSFPRHLIEFPPSVWEDQREEARRWGDRDPARWGDDPPPADERPMARRLAEWEAEVAAIARQNARSRKLTEEVYQPHGVFEQAMPPNTTQDRIAFRYEGEYIARILRHDLLHVAEGLILEYQVAVGAQSIQQSSKTRALANATPKPIRRGRPNRRKRSPAQLRRSREVHAECDPALDFLGWSAPDWADSTCGRVSPSAVVRIMNGETVYIRSSTAAHLRDALKEALAARGRLDLLMNSPRWMQITLSSTSSENALINP
jgi:hypothetical protein